MHTDVYMQGNRYFEKQIRTVGNVHSGWRNSTNGITFSIVRHELSSLLSDEQLRAQCQRLQSQWSLEERGRADVDEKQYPSSIGSGSLNHCPGSGKIPQ
jgi:hypothetical protein